MPLLLTPTDPFQTTAHLPATVAYAIILQVRYRTRERVIDFEVGYYASEESYLAQATQLECNQLPRSFAQPATAEEANAVPIFQFLEQVLTQQLQQQLPAGTTIETVP